MSASTAEYKNMDMDEEDEYSPSLDTRFLQRIDEYLNITHLGTPARTMERLVKLQRIGLSLSLALGILRSVPVFLLEVQSLMWITLFTLLTTYLGYTGLYPVWKEIHQQLFFVAILVCTLLEITIMFVIQNMVDASLPTFQFYQITSWLIVAVNLSMAYLSYKMVGFYVIIFLIKMKINIATPLVMPPLILLCTPLPIYTIFMEASLSLSLSLSFSLLVFCYMY